jgi:signal recognition particle receptor subunit beta
VGPCYRILVLHVGSRLSGKVVYAGPYKSGKSTNVQWIATNGGYDDAGALLRMHVQERMVGVVDDAIVISSVLPAVDVRDDVYGYDFLPLVLGALDGQDLAVNFYALPGHPDAHEWIDRMWRGVDVIVFVADSRRSSLEANVQSWKRVRTNRWFDRKTTCILQLNRRDAPNAMPVSELVAALRWRGAVHEAVASTGTGVAETMTEVVNAVTRKAKEALLADR